jgi:flagellar protein FlbD
MIRLTRISHSPIVLNADLIQSIESTPDTVITLTSGQKLMVRESSVEVVDLVVAYRRRIQQPVLPVSEPPVEGQT